jgi:putative FmdB family regulatory protein
MPMYDYRCKACGARFEAWQKFTDDPISVCPTCSGPAQRVIHAAGIMFKGSGFYSTDSKSAAAIPPADATAPAADGAKASEKASEKASGETSAAKPATAVASTGTAAPASTTTSGSAASQAAPATKAS